MPSVSFSAFIIVTSGAINREVNLLLCDLALMIERGHHQFGFVRKVSCMMERASGGNF
jgi:hypothetical protein